MMPAYHLRTPDRTHRRLATRVSSALATSALALALLSSCGGPSGLAQGALPAPAALRTPAGKTPEAKTAAGPAEAAVAPIGAPEPQPAVALRLPPLHRFRLANGLRVLFVQDRNLPLVQVKLLIGTGSIDDPPDKVGLADFTFMMLRQGVRKRDAEAIAKAVDSAGARLSVGAGYETSSIACGGRTTYNGPAARGRKKGASGAQPPASGAKTLELCADLVSELLLQPTFPAKEMAEIQDSLRGSIKGYRDNPSQLAALHFYNMLYGDDHPGGRPLTYDAIKAIGRKDLLAFHRTQLRPGRSLLVISGDLDLAEARRVAQKLAPWRRGKLPKRKVPKLIGPAPGLRVLLIDKPSLSQASFYLGHAGVTRRSPQRDALRLANWVLGGGGFSSRLMKRVRARSGQTYGISSAFRANDDDGIFRIASTTKNETLVSSLRMVVAELRTLHAKPPTAQELKAAVGNIAGGYAIGFKTGSQLAGALASAELRGFDDAYVTDFPLRIQRLSAAQVAAAAKAAIHPQRLALAIVGKAAVVGPLLRKAGIAFEQLSFLDPISARERARAAAKVTITPAEQRSATKLLKQAFAAMGPATKLKRLRSLRISGTMSRGRHNTRYEVLVLQPDKMRLTMELQLPGAKLPQFRVVQVLDGTSAFMLNSGKKTALPPHMVETLRAALWRQPGFILQNALDPKTRKRPAKSERAELLAVEVFPPHGPRLTLLLNKSTRLLVGIKKRSRDGRSSLTRLSAHRRVEGLWLPFQSESGAGTRSQRSEAKTITLNPKLSPSELTQN